MSPKLSILTLSFASSVLLNVVLSKDVAPRGVGPDFAKHYDSHNGGRFTCIGDSSIELNFQDVNNDYCDCPDGSDEPGTAACAHLTANKLTLPGFYCQNKGHNPAYVPFTTVNDGVCNYDLCCDGSDEWEQVGGVVCEDRCGAIGNAWKREEQARLNALARANKARNKFVTDSARLRNAINQQIVNKDQEIAEGKVKVVDLEKRLEQVEAEERENNKARNAVNQKFGHFLSSLSKKDEERRGMVQRLKADIDVARSSLVELEGILSRLRTEYNPNFNDDGVKAAVKEWDNYAAQKQDDGVASDNIEDVVEADITDDKVEWEAFQDSVMDHIPKISQNSMMGSIREYLANIRLKLEDAGVLPPKERVQSESREVSGAKRDLEMARSSLTQAQKDLKSFQEDLAADYGPDGLFRALKGRCLEKSSGGYTYEVCFGGRTSQKPQHGGTSVSMGSFVRIDQVEMDVNSAISSGSSLDGVDDVRTVLRYENGQHCWNGPNRKASVVLVCSDVEELRSIAEEEMCVYRMVLASPAGCVADDRTGRALGESEEKSEL